MGFITVDHSKAQQGRYMPPEGNYECVIKDAKYDTTMGGKQYLHITLTIRDDIKQEGAGESIDWPVYKKREPGRNDPSGFPAGTLQHISRVSGMNNGANYETIEDWMKALIRKPIRVDIKHEEYNGSTKARVSYVYETEHPSVSLGAQGYIEVNDEDVPF